jgi:prefoldin subunit 5
MTCAVHKKISQARGLNMDKVLHDILNAGIALFRAGEGTVNNAIKEVQRTYDELKSKGAADTSEPAVKLRKLLDDTVAQVNDLSGKAGGAYNDALSKLEEQYGQISEQIQKLIPQEQMDQIKDKIEELTRVIKEKTGGAKA